MKNLISIYGVLLVALIMFFPGDVAGENKEKCVEGEPATLDCEVWNVTIEFGPETIVTCEIGGNLTCPI